MATFLSTCGPPSNTRFLGTSEPTTLTASQSVQPFLHRSVPILYNGTSLSPKNAPSHGEVWTPISYMVPWAHQSPQPIGISIGSAVFAGLTNVTDRPTDHATRSVTRPHLYVRSTAMRPNKNGDEIVKMCQPCRQVHEASTDTSYSPRKLHSLGTRCFR